MAVLSLDPLTTPYHHTLLLHTLLLCPKVSVDYLSQPMAVLAEIRRVLTPGLTRTLTLSRTLTLTLTLHLTPTLSPGAQAGRPVALHLVQPHVPDQGIDS